MYMYVPEGGQNFQVVVLFMVPKQKRGRWGEGEAGKVPLRDAGVPREKFKGCQVSRPVCGVTGPAQIPCCHAFGK